MKKVIILSLIFICVTFCFLTGCEQIKDDMGIKPGSTDIKEYIVTFVSEGKTFHSTNVFSGGVISVPMKTPTKTNYVFTGWSSSPDIYIPFDFTQKIYGSTKVYAYFDFDIETAKEGIEKLRAGIVSVENKCYNTDDDAVIFNGVGYIFYKNERYCYAITSYNAMNSVEGYKNQQVSVTDCDGNVYRGYGYQRSENDPEAVISEYGLAVVCFEYSGSKLKVLSRDDKTPSVDDVVVSIGKAGTDESYGKVTEYKESADKSYSFKVIHHTAALEGQNQALLFNLNMTLAGITYLTEDGVSYTIPSYKIKEFLDRYVYN